MGQPVTFELTYVGLFVELANHYTTRGTLLDVAWSQDPFNKWVLLHIHIFCHSNSVL